MPGGGCLRKGFVLKSIPAPKMVESILLRFGMWLSIHLNIFLARQLVSLHVSTAGYGSCDCAIMVRDARSEHIVTYDCVSL